MKNNFNEDIFSEDTNYKRDLGLLESSSIVIGRIIGSGIFMTPAIIMGVVKYTSLFGIVWILGGIVTVFGAVCYAELVAMMPRSGGPYVFLKAAYNPVWAFLRGWAMFFVSETGAIAAVSLVFAEYSKAMWATIYGKPFSHVTEIIIAFSIIWILTIINMFGVFFSGMVQNFFGLMKIIAIGAIIGISFTSSSGNLSHFVNPLWPDKFSWGTILVVGEALRFSFFAFSGWEGATYVAEEVKNPRRNLPLSLFIGIGGVMLLYVGANSAYLYQLPVEIFKESNSIATDAMIMAIGSVGGILISIAVMLSTFGNVSTQVLCKARAWQAMARDGVFFDKFSVISQRFQTPNNALLYQGIWASVLLFFAAMSKNSYKTMISFFAATSVIFNIMTFYSVFILRKKYPEANRPYKAWLYPYSLIVILIIYIAYLILTLITAPIPSVIGLALTSTGLIYYYFKVRQR